MNPPEREYVSIGNLDRKMDKDYLVQHGYLTPNMIPANVGYGGVLAGTNDVLVGPQTIANGDDADGRAKSFTSFGGAGDQAGIDGGVGPVYNMTQTRWNPFVAVRFKLAQIVTQRFWFGLFAASPLGADVNIEGVGIRASTVPAITNFAAYSSDGVIDNIQNFPVAVAQNALVHWAIITFKNAGLGVSIQLDNQKVDFTTRLPAVITPLAMTLAVQATGIAVKVLRIYRGYVEHDARVINVL